MDFGLGQNIVVSFNIFLFNFILKGFADLVELWV